MTEEHGKWPVIRLEKLADSIDYGLTASATRERKGPKFLRITDIQNGQVDWDAVPYCEFNMVDDERYQLAPGDIVFARTGATTGKSFLVRQCPEGAVFASYLIRVRPNSSIDPAFLFRFFQTPDYWRQISRRATGTAQAGVNASNLKSLLVPFPPLIVQRRIAALLDKAEALLEKRRQAVVKLNELARSVFIKMFGDPVTNPKGWSTVHLGEVAEIVSGAMKGRKFNGHATVQMPYLRVANVQDGYLDLQEVKKIEVRESDVERYKLKIGDILMTEGGDPDKLGRGAIWRGEIKDCLHQNHIFRVRVNPKVLVPEFLNSLTSSEHGKRYFLRAAKQTTGIATINMTQLRGFPVLLPPIELQREYANFVGSVKALASRIQASSKKLDDLFKSIQQRAFSGELFTEEPSATVTQKTLFNLQ